MITVDEANEAFEAADKVFQEARKACVPTWTAYKKAIVAGEAPEVYQAAFYVTRDARDIAKKACDDAETALWEALEARDGGREEFKELKKQWGGFWTER